MMVQWRSDETLKKLSIRVSRWAQVDTTTSLHPGSYGSSLRLENVTLTSGKFRVVLSPSLVSKGVERGEVGSWASAASRVAARARAKHRQSRATLATFGDWHHIPGRWK